MLENLINQINHLGYKITQDLMRKSTWKIVSPSRPDDLYTLEYEENKVLLYKDDICLCELSESEDLFLILRYLPEILFLDNKDHKSCSIEVLYDYCSANNDRQKNLILKILNSKSINQFKSRRDYAYYVANCIVESGFLLKNKSIDLSLIDIILNIV